jgi:hypothetical protein
LSANIRVFVGLAGATMVALGSLLISQVIAQEDVATRLCVQYWDAPEVRTKLRADCACVGRYFASINADPVDVEVHLRTFASVYTGKVQEEADALRAKLGAEKYQGALERSRNFLSGMLTRGGCKLGPA